MIPLNMDSETITFYHYWFNNGSISDKHGEAHRTQRAKSGDNNNKDLENSPVVNIENKLNILGFEMRKLSLNVAMDLSAKA